MTVEIADDINTFQKHNGVNGTDIRNHDSDDGEESIGIASTAKHAEKTVAPFLARHIPDQYAPLGGQTQAPSRQQRNPNSKYCYRHRPDLKCRRQADEPSMDQLQRVSNLLSSRLDPASPEILLAGMPAIES